MIIEEEVHLTRREFILVKGKLPDVPIEGMIYVTTSLTKYHYLKCIKGKMIPWDFKKDKPITLS